MIAEPEISFRRRRAITVREEGLLRGDLGHSIGGCATAVMATTDIPTPTAVPMINCVMLLFCMIASNAIDCSRLSPARVLSM